MANICLSIWNCHLQREGRISGANQMLNSSYRCRNYSGRNCIGCRTIKCQAAPTAASTSLASKRVLLWLAENGAPEQKVTAQKIQFRANGHEVDLTVAAEPLAEGDIALRIPEHLIVTLDRVFEDEALAELLTTNKLSELACLTLYLSYEKKKKQDSFWYPLIKELDRQGGRGAQGAKSPLLWEPGQVETLLAGSPVLKQIQQRLEGIAREYEELDTVWYLSGSLFNKYPFEVPSEQFSLELFTQAFAAIQSSVVHLQGVPLGKRFALVPLGPPLLSYSSTCRALLKYNAEAKEVQLAVDRSYEPGEPILAWCGPQPNSRLLINYGVVDDDNPYDKLPLGITIPSDDPLYRLKMQKLAEKGNNLSTQQTFQLSRFDPLPANLLSYLSCAFAVTEEEVQAVEFPTNDDPKEQNLRVSLSAPNTQRGLAQLGKELDRRISGYRTTIAEDDAIVEDPNVGARERVAARLLRIEKSILLAAQKKLHDEYKVPKNTGNLDSDTLGIVFSSI